LVIIYENRHFLASDEVLGKERSLLIRIFFEVSDQNAKKKHASRFGGGVCCNVLLGKQE
jgi:hypothetical protein